MSHASIADSLIHGRSAASIRPSDNLHHRSFWHFPIVIRRWQNNSYTQLLYSINWLAYQSFVAFIQYMMVKFPLLFTVLVLLGTVTVNAVLYDRPCRTDVPVVQNFALTRYLGKWYELQRFEKDFQTNYDCVQAEYGLLDPTTVSVRNSAYSLVNETSIEAIGTAKFSFPEQDIVQAKLNVSFFGAREFLQSWPILQTLICKLLQPMTGPTTGWLIPITNTFLSFGLVSSWARIGPAKDIGSCRGRVALRTMWRQTQGLFTPFVSTSIERRFALQTSWTKDVQIFSCYFNNIIRFVTTKVPFNKLNVIVTKAKRGKFADGNKCNHHRKAPEVEKL